MHIITNHIPRATLHGKDLSEAERAWYDFYPPQALDRAAFFRYKGRTFDLLTFSPVDKLSWWPDTRQRWDVYRSETDTVGVVVRYCNEYKDVVVGLAIHDRQKAETSNHPNT